MNHAMQSMQAIHPIQRMQGLSLFRRFAALLWLGIFGVSPAVLAVEPVAERRLALNDFVALKQGGFVIYMRHGKTDPAIADRPVVIFSDCTTQRPLVEAGRKMAADIGRHLRKARIPIGDIYVSPMCRTRESAQQVFGKDVQFEVVTALFSSTNQTSEEKKPSIAALQKFLSDPVPAGSNRFILAHAPNLADLMGYFPKTEGTVVIFRPNGDSFEYLGSVLPDQWRDFVK